MGEGDLGDSHFTTLTPLPHRRLHLAASYLDVPRLIALPRDDVIDCEDLPAALGTAMAGVHRTPALHSQSWADLGPEITRASFVPTFWTECSRPVLHEQQRVRASQRRLA